MGLHSSQAYVSIKASKRKNLIYADCNVNVNPTSNAGFAHILFKQQISLRDYHLYQFLEQNSLQTAHPDRVVYRFMEIYCTLESQSVHLEILIYGFLLTMGLLEVSARTS